ncbi:MAG: glycine cleavage system aminomethyltransferase GcvT [Planctomycetota bacterium]
MTDLLRTPLYDLHNDLGATLVEFAGWHMPIRYRSIREEHQQVRASGGLFDVSHMGRVKILGRQARRLVERLCTRRVSDMQQGQCRYSLVLNERGGIKDDVLVYRLDEDEFLLVVNASNRAKLLEHFETVRAAGDLTVSIEDQTITTSMVAIQGPKVMDLVSKVSAEVGELKRYRFAVKNLMITKLTVSRTGYTGEDGVEVILPAGSTGLAMKLLMKDSPLGEPDSPIQAIGLAARDTLRLEAGMALYGNELTEETPALSTGLGFAINPDKADDERGEPFVGLGAIHASEKNGGPQRRLVGLRLEGTRTARPHMPVANGGQHVGQITSGCLSPTLDASIAMAYVDRDSSETGTQLEVDLGRARAAAEVVILPFYKRR